MAVEGEERICPLCGQDNNCQYGEEGNCWCINYKIPQYILDMVPEDKKNKSCICRSCIEKHIKDNASNDS
ncbi:cysteine-rich CWC family protein [Dethiobacter alkaliphilus]|uniref:cysteine-rich CWC family protein n=1 Tax=Dethiobacter alkaliphilus TaxID=427926 RepID=UPI002227DD72|nr:cysteine-rich CWC family protein [Dethiobacter alkaliphilus]MCW3490313.1 cysteine-rich CWC family protein [Dethiobacter alkaliphilus]